MEWDKTIQGHLLSAFFYGYMVTQVPSGLLAGRFGGKHVFGAGMLLCTICTLLSPIAARTHYSLLILLRVLIGIGTVSTTQGRSVYNLEMSERLTKNVAACGAC